MHVGGWAHFSTNQRANGVRVAYLPLLKSAPLFVADEEGFFRTHGINLAKTPTTDIDVMLAPL